MKILVEDKIHKEAFVSYKENTLLGEVYRNKVTPGTGWNFNTY